MYVKKVEDTEQKYNELNVNFNELKTSYDDLSSRVEGYVSDNSTLKRNYNRVLEELSKYKEQEVVTTTPLNNVLPLSDKRKSKKPDSEWVDAD